MTTEIQQNIRTARVEDSQNLAALAGKAFLGYPFEYVFTADGIKNAIQNGERRYVMVDLNNQTIGSAVLGINDSKMAEIMRVMIAPSMRKNGVATSLTRELALDAIKLGKYSWADVRGDQIGMQRAALGSGLKAISLEQGKHVVYNHYDENGSNLGPARETMVHMTTLPVDELAFAYEISILDIRIREQLVKNLRGSMSPSIKDESICRNILSSASKTKEHISNNLGLNAQSIESIVQINDDIVKIKIGDVETIVVLPDASAFILNGTQIHQTTDLLAKVGIQVATYYCNINSNDMENRLIDSGLEAVSIRPWIDETNGQNVWQIAWRKTANDYKYCLHTISLDRIVERQINKIINIIEG